MAIRDTPLMVVDDGAVALFLPMFEDMVPRRGPEGAFRELCRVAGEPGAYLVRQAYQKKVGIIAQQEGPTTLKKQGLTNWYSGPSDHDRFWPALQRYLLEEKGWAPDTVTSIDTESTSVMRLLPFPGGTVKAKGLVVGYVQSGKTANYTALIAKAADVGYRLIIVMAGIHNGLRRQTQQRLQAELVNVSSKLSSEWHTLTQPLEDFRGSNTNTDAFLAEHSHQKILLVVKKNAHVLRRLVSWLNKGQQRLRAQCPALIIDDEADQAGLNTGKDKRTAVNASILELLDALPKSAYVGYTATPFANVLVDPSGEDLYPEDFIVALRKPAGYFGTELFFGRDPLVEEGEELPPGPDMFRVVTTEEVPLLRPAIRSQVNTFVPTVPDSLRKALLYFLLATAARWERGHRRKHSSMLIHTALNTRVHTLLADAVQKELNRLKGRSFAAKKLRNELEKLWNEESARVTVPGLSAVSFESLWPRIPEVISRTRVVEDNGQSDNRLVYKEELHLTDEDDVAHVAVGGNTLSRGLTLEGLVVSYFVRSSSTYDTLLQMGRWFGYRFGYEDLPRLWMTEELQYAFHDLATVEEEIRRDIARYEDDGVTPRQLAVRIRTHPTLAITSRLKMQFAVKGGVNYAGLTRQTTKFKKDEAWLSNNWKAGGTLLDDLRAKFEQHTATRHTYFTGVPEGTVRRFLAAYHFHEDHDDLRLELLEKYLDAQVKRGRCRKWTVAVASLKALNPELGEATLGSAGKPFNLINRSVKANRTPPPDSVDLGTMTTQADFRVGLPEELLIPPQEDDGAGKKKKKKQINRPESSEPLLLLYPISNRSNGLDDIASNVLGVALAFPKMSASECTSEQLEYVHVELPPDIDEDELPPELDEDDG